MRYDRQQLDLGAIHLVCSKFTGIHSDASMAEWFDTQLQLLTALRERRKRLVHVFDLTQATALGAEHRRMQASWNTRYEQLVRDTTLGHAFVVSSVLMRGVITAVHWLRPATTPTAVYTNLDDTLVWTFALCEEAGTVVLPALQQEARRLFTAQMEARATP